MNNLRIPVDDTRWNVHRLGNHLWTNQPSDAKIGF